MPVLHVQQSSTQFSDPARVFLADLETTLSRGAHVIGFTEVGARRRLLQETCREAGYFCHAPDDGDTAVAVQADLRVLHVGNLFVHAGQSGPPRLGGHGPRFITSARFLWEGNKVWFGEAHWVTGFSRSELRRSQHQAMTEAMTEEVQHYGRGRALAFFAGDINIDERTDLGQDHRKPDWMFEQAHLETIWDELDFIAPTRGRSTIDIIGSYERDGRVTGRTVKVWPAGGKDHRDVSAFFEVCG